MDEKEEEAVPEPLRRSALWSNYFLGGSSLAWEIEAES